MAQPAIPIIEVIDAHQSLCKSCGRRILSTLNAPLIYPDGPGFVDSEKSLWLDDVLPIPFAVLTPGIHPRVDDVEVESPSVSLVLDE